MLPLVRRIWFRLRAAKPLGCSTFLPTPLRLRLWDAQIPYGPGLRHFQLVTGEVFCFLITRGNRTPNLVFRRNTPCHWAIVGLTDDVLLHVVPLPFGPQNATHHRTLLLAGYLRSPDYTSEAAAPNSESFMDIALDCGLGLTTLTVQSRFACQLRMPPRSLNTCRWVPHAVGLLTLLTITSPPVART